MNHLRKNKKSKSAMRVSSSKMENNMTARQKSLQKIVRTRFTKAIKSKTSKTIACRIQKKMKGPKSKRMFLLSRKNKM